jgi:hypothetical protein
MLCVDRQSGVGKIISRSRDKRIFIGKKIMGDPIERQHYAITLIDAAWPLAATI